MTQSVYKAICAVQSELSKIGITKDHHNKQQGYQFRGIDDCYNALSPLLAKNGLCILPRVLARTCTERQTAKGGTLFFVAVEVEFDFVAAEDGSKHVVKTFGEAMDSADKATNKAMSAAYKYAVMQAFAIPTEGDNDADATTHEVAAYECITERQAADLMALAEEVNADGGAFLKFLAKQAQVPVATFADIPVGWHDWAADQLHKKGQK